MKKIGIIILMLLMMVNHLHAQSIIVDDVQVLSESEKVILDARLSFHDSQIAIYCSDEQVDINTYHQNANEIIIYYNEDTTTIDICGYGEYESYPIEDIEMIANERLNKYGCYEAMQSSIVNIERIYDGKTLNTGYIYHDYVVDDSNCFTDDEINFLSDYIERITNEHQIDVAIYVEDYSVYESEQRAVDLYDYEFYGYGRNDSGILFYLALEDRKYQFVTFGEGRTRIDPYMDELADDVVAHLSNDDFYQACLIYLDRVEDILRNDVSQFENDNRYDHENYYDNDVESKPNILLWVGGAFIVSLIIAFVLTAIKQRQMNTARKNENAHYYLKQTKMNMSESKDIFLYSTITKSAKPKDDDHGSGGSSSSSSGRSHGVSGGSF